MGIDRVALEVSVLIDYSVGVFGDLVFAVVSDFDLQGEGVVEGVHQLCL
jgi:hypothetical protein